MILRKRICPNKIKVNISKFQVKFKNVFQALWNNEKNIKKK